jgi:hypothetical protein
MKYILLPISWGQQVPPKCYYLAFIIHSITSPQDHHLKMNRVAKFKVLVAVLLKAHVMGCEAIGIELHSNMSRDNGT